MNKVKVSIYHDTRKAIVKDNEKKISIYPVKLRVYYKEDRQLYLEYLEKLGHWSEVINATIA